MATPTVPASWSTRYKRIALLLGLCLGIGLPARSEARADRAGRTACRLKRMPTEQLTLPFEGSRSPLARWMVRSIAPRTCRALNRLIASKRRGPATFDADGTLWKNDVGVGFFSWMMTNHYYPAGRVPML